MGITKSGLVVQAQHEDNETHFVYSFNKLKNDGSLEIKTCFISIGYDKDAKLTFNWMIVTGHMNSEVPDTSQEFNTEAEAKEEYLNIIKSRLELVIREMWV